jgi:GT2 family glycosyltransferase
LLPRVWGIVINWNGWSDTAACLASLRCLQYENFDVVVVDNGSTDDSVSRIREAFPGIELIETGKNLGFAGGCNIGIRWALRQGANFVWLLNNDAVVDPRALQALVSKAGTDPAIGAVGSAVYHMEEPETLQSWGGGHVNFWLGRSRHFLQPVPDDKLDYITGASLLIRRDALESVGLLDEGFFFSWEDADLSFRLRQAKWKLAVAGDSKVWHRLTASLRDRNAVLDTYFNQSASRFFRKHAPIPRLSFFIGVALRIAKRVSKGEWKRARAVCNGVREQSSRTDQPNPVISVNAQK